METEQKEEFTSISSYIEPMKSLINSQERVVKKNNFLDVVADNALKNNYFKMESEIVAISLSHAETITKIAKDNKTFDSEIYQSWMKILLSFFNRFEKRVNKYLKEYPLDSMTIDSSFKIELNFQQDLVADKAKFKVKYNKLKKELSTSSNEDVDLRWKGDLAVPITMKSVIVKRHPHIQKLIDNKLAKIKKDEPRRSKGKTK